MVITGAVTDAVITPDTATVVACVAPSSGGGGVRGSSATPAATPAVPAVPATPGEIPGCGTRTTGFSSSTGGSCVGNTSTTPATPVTPTTPVTPASPTLSASAYNFGTTVLKNGSQGEAVKELQRFLNDKLNLGLAVDGALGPKTIAVIKQWQADNGLVADGLIGPATKAMMQ